MLRRGTKVGKKCMLG